MSITLVIVLHSCNNYSNNMHQVQDLKKEVHSLRKECGPIVIHSDSCSVLQSDDNDREPPWL